MIASSVPVAGASSWLPYAVPVIVALASGGGLAALLKSRPEGTKILVDAAQGLVVVQTGVITDLRTSLARAEAQIDELRSHVSEMSTLRTENDRLNRRVDELERENSRLKARVSELETRT